MHSILVRQTHKYTINIKVLSALSVLSSMVQPDRQSECTTHTHPLSSPATVTFNLFHPNSYTPTRTGCLKIKIIVCSSLGDPSFNGVSVIMCKVIHTDRRSVPLYLSALRGLCNYISLKHIFTQPVSLSIRSTSHWRCDSYLMAAYSWMKVCGCSDAWSSVISLPHCCCGSSLILCRARMSSTPMTASWNKKSMMLAGLTFLITVWCSFWNFSFNTAFDSVTVKH